MKMSTIYTTDKEEANLIHWAESACSKDKDRPSLMGLYVQEQEVAACDGARLHIIPLTEILKPFIGKIIRLFGSISVNKIIKVEEIEGNYPNYKEIMPKEMPVFEIDVSATQLKQALELAAKNKDLSDQRVTLKFYGGTKPFEMIYRDTRGLIMP